MSVLPIHRSKIARHPQRYSAALVQLHDDAAAVAETELSSPLLAAAMDRVGQALAAGLPANFFVPNPLVDDVNVTDSGAFSDYHALQLDLRKRLSKGLSANVNYQYAIEGGSAFAALIGPALAGLLIPFIGSLGVVGLGASVFSTDTARANAVLVNVFLFSIFSTSPRDLL